MPYTPDTFANYASSAVATALTATGTTLQLPTNDGAKFPVVGPFRLLLGTSTGSYELVECTARSGDTLTIVRGNNLPAPDTTTNQPWGVNTPVQQVTTAGNLTNLWTAINQGRVFNVKDYGALGDGHTNDRPAIQAALNAAAAATQAPPSAPGLSQGGSGNFAQNNVVNVVVTYLTARGETAVSASSQITISVPNSSVTVQLPTFPSGVWGMNVYASSASGGTTLYKVSSGNGPTSTTSGGTFIISNFASTSNVLAPAQDTTGGGCVYFPVGAYYVSTTTNPTDSTYSGALFVYSNTMLRGDGPQESIIKLASTAANQASVIQNAHISAAGGAYDTNIVICDLQINGNSYAVNQTNTVDRNRGIHLAYCRDIRIFNVVSKNCLGLGGGTGPHGTVDEGHHIVTYNSSDVLFENCIVYSDDGGPTASGIAAGDCEAVRIIGCVAHDMQYGWGITTYDISGSVIADCTVYLCNSGIFVEIGTDVTVSGCTISGTAPFQSAAYPFSTGQALGGAGFGGGIASRGTINLRVISCTCYGNHYGLTLQNETSPARNQQNTVIVGCRFDNNTTAGTYVNGVNDVTFIGCTTSNNTGPGFYVDTITSGWVRYIGCNAVGNSTWGYECHGTTSPYIRIHECLASGNTNGDVYENGGTYPISGNLTAPPIGTSTYTNAFATPVMVYIAGGTNVSITVNGTLLTNLTGGAVRLKSGDTIKLSYNTAPAWTWLAE